MIKKLLKLTVSAAILTTMIHVTPTFADTPVTNGQIEATKDQVEDLETKVQQLDDRIGTAIEKTQQLTVQINTQQQKITETKVEIDEAKKSLDTHKKVYSERLKSIQLEGKTSLATYAELLLSSDSLAQLFNRFSAISKVMENDTDLLKGLTEKEEALKTAQEKLNTEYAALKEKQNQLASEQRRIEEDKNAIGKVLAETQSKLHAQETQFAVQEAQKEAQRRAAAEQLAQQTKARQTIQKKPSTSSRIPASTPKVNTSNVSSSEAASTLIEYAKQFLGTPYVWGGSTPSGFDCSGFTSYVFRNALGINLPRVSRDQQRVGTRISPYDVKPGDLVFRGNPAYHVGIYIGNGQYIHSPQTGDVVKIASYNPAKFTTASRVLP